MRRQSWRYLDPQRQRQHKLRNLLQTGLLLEGMALLLAVLASLLGGAWFAFMTLTVSVLLFTLTPKVTPALLLRFYRCQPLTHHNLPGLLHIVEELAQRADMPKPPQLYLIPSTTLNAFSMGGSRHAVIAMTSGLLQSLSNRELAGVLAHEISHIRHNDLWIMGVADMISRLTSLLSWVGLMLLLFNLPLAMMGYGSIPWLLILLLVFAPTIGSLLQLALSRSREYDADLDAAGLTADPVGLASALRKLEYYNRPFGAWEEILLPGRRMPDPSMLRTHPPTEERVKRLLELYEPDFEFYPFENRHSGQRLGITEESPRWRWPGFWF